MRVKGLNAAIELFSTCPPRKISSDDRTYLQEVIDAARWSEEAGYQGILVYTANAAQADPWILAHIIVQNTQVLCPLVAIQPLYMHPYTVAKLITSLSNMYYRRIDLNLVAGGFKNDLTSLNDSTPHDKRYDRLVEYSLIIKRLLENRSAITWTGEFYSIDNLRLEPPLPKSLLPRFFVSGSSEAGAAAARKTGAVAMHYPGQDGGNPKRTPEGPSGLRVGIIARADDDHAWDVALRRFPEDRKGQLTYRLAMSVTDSVWHKQLSRMETGGAAGNRDLYWLGPFKNYKDYCPYLVGSYTRVAEELAKHIAAGNTAFILDFPPDNEESVHVNRAFERALQLIEEKFG